MEDVIKERQYVVIQRQNFTKLHKFADAESTVQLGRDTVALSCIAGHNWYKTFKMNLKESGKRRLYTLEPCENVTGLKEILQSIESGTDNRNINDDGQSQSLSSEEILNLRENFTHSKDLVGTLVANSKSFNSKTEFSQEKYIKKKEKKYFDYIQVRKPTIRLIAEIFYRQDPDKPLGLRIDSLSQLISYSGVCSSGNYLLYESGTSGLVEAAFLNSMGSSGDARLVHLHPGNFPQKQAVLALNLEEAHMKKTVSVNLYSVLRQFYQTTSNGEVASTLEEGSENRKRKADEGEEEDGASLAKKQHTDESLLEASEPVAPTEPAKPVRPFKIPKWQLENEEAIKVLKQKFDSLIIVAKEDPSTLVKELLCFVHPGRPIVIFHTCKEILMECYNTLRSLDLINIRLLTNWMRNYQVLPMRTHPAVQINGTSGYFLVGYTPPK